MAKKTTLAKPENGEPDEQPVPRRRPRGEVSISLSNRVLELYAEAILSALKMFRFAPKQPETKEEAKHRRALERSREDARNSQSLARAEIDSALAARIRNSNTVEIEEYYDASGKAFAGLNSEEDSLKVGAQAEGQRVVRRKIILNGKPQDELEPPTQLPAEK